MSPTVSAAADGLAERMIQWRRHLHAHPELSGQERATADFVAQELERLGYRPKRPVGDGYGLIVDLDADGGPAIGLRADMDALPIQEETGLDYASESAGVMHACGHDAHMAMMLGAAALLKERQSELKRSVRLIFQPHEEHYPGGASGMIAAGVLDNVESVFGLHIWSQLPLGVLGVGAGPLMSSVNDLEIRVHGRGGHAAMPEDCLDPVVISAEIVLALQTVVSRSIAMTDRAVVSVARVTAGTGDNIIPELAVMRGTIRTLSSTVRTKVCQRVIELAKGIAAGHGAMADAEVFPGYPVLVNSEDVVRRALTAARHIGWDENLLRTMSPMGGAEDFAYYAERVPAALVFLGAALPDGSSRPHHHPGFRIDERALPRGAALLAQFALDAGRSN
ncbi:MAG: M20 family metallopeptidase [Phycisphaerae bacterium]|jgi:amidohydrolase